MNKALTHQRREGNTLAAHLGFADPDIQTPGHDAMVAYVAALVPEMIEREVKWDKAAVKRFVETNPEAEDAEWVHLDASGQPTLVPHVMWEAPILRNRSRSVVGFADLRVSLDIPEVYHQRWVSGLRAGVTSHIRLIELNWYFEIKPFIPSLGELFRQLNLYRLHMPAHARIYVASPDTRYREIILQQGFRFLPLGETTHELTADGS